MSAFNKSKLYWSQVLFSSLFEITGFKNINSYNKCSKDAFTSMLNINVQTKNYIKSYLTFSVFI